MKGKRYGQTEYGRDYIAPSLGLAIGITASRWWVDIGGERERLWSGATFASGVMFIVLCAYWCRSYSKFQKWIFETQIGMTVICFVGSFACSLLGVVWYLIPWSTWWGTVAAVPLMVLAIVSLQKL